MMRAARILIHDMLQGLEPRLVLSNPTCGVTTASGLDQPISLEVRLSIIDICATMPPHYRPPGDSPKTTDFSNPPLIGTVYWLLWPLEVVGSSRETPSELREWICQCFTRIHDLTGVAKARVVVDRLAGKRGASIVN